MKHFLLINLFFVILCSCSRNDEVVLPEPTVSELLEGKWRLVERQVFWAGDGEPYDELTPPDYNSIIEFKLKDYEVINNPLDYYIVNGELHFIYGDIMGSSETRIPEYWSYWPFSWDVFEVSMIARVDDMSFPRSFTIHEIGENSLILIFHYFWFDTKLYFERYEESP